MTTLTPPVIAPSPSFTLGAPEKAALKHTMCLIYLKGQKPSGETAFVYLAVMADALERLTAELRSNRPVNVMDYGRVLMAACGAPNEYLAQRALLDDDYAFAEDATNVSSIPSVTE